MCNFNKDDVITIAKAVMKEPLNYMDGDFMPYYYCKYCDAEEAGYGVRERDFMHDLNCPVLIAQDILTGQ